MVFTTQYLKNARLEAFVRCLLAACLCLLCLLHTPAARAAAAAEITQLRTERAEDGVHLSAMVRFDVPPVVEDALLKGIAIYFVVEAEVYRERWYWTDQRVSSAARTLRLAYQPLTGRWRVNIVPGLVTSSSGLRATLSQNYDSMQEALSVVQRVSRWKIAEASEVDPGEQYMLNLNFWLDLSQLPRPFQIGVAGQRDWTIAAQLKDRLRLAPVSPAAEGGK